MVKYSKILDDLLSSIFQIHIAVTSALKVGLSPSKKVVFIYVNESSLKMMKNDFYLMLKALFVLEIFTFLYRISGYVENWLDK